jgi:hypothetical protein
MNFFYKIILFLFFWMSLNGCVTNTNVSKKPILQSPEVKVEKEKEDIMWVLPGWCDNVRQELFEFRACGIAKSPNLQTSRTRSELDSRKQIIKILNSKCNNSENQNILDGKDVFNSTLNCETGDVKIKYTQVLKRKTERVNGNFITFTLMSLPHN